MGKKVPSELLHWRGRHTAGKKRSPARLQNPAQGKSRNMESPISMRQCQRLEQAAEPSTSHAIHSSSPSLPATELGRRHLSRLWEFGLQRHAQRIPISSVPNVHKQFVLLTHRTLAILKWCVWNWERQQKGVRPCPRTAKDPWILFQTSSHLGSSLNE